MKDIETTVINTVAAAVKAEYPDAFVTADYVSEAPRFPCVSCAEISNEMNVLSLDMSMKERLSDVEYEFNIFTHGAAKKRDGVAIRGIVDNAMQSMQFTRSFCETVPNAADLRIWRYVLRYTKII